MDLPLLTGPERDQILVEWNRTEIDHPASRCLPELIDEQADAYARGGGRGLRRPAIDLSGIERAREPVGAPFAKAGGGTGQPGGALCGPLAGNGRRNAGHPQGRRRLCAARPEISSGAAGIRTPGCQRPGLADPGPSRRNDAGVGRAGDPAGCGLAGNRPRKRRPGGKRRHGEASGLCHLHLGLDRPAEGRRDLARGAGEFPAFDAATARPDRPGRASCRHHDLLRHCRPGNLPAPGDRRPRGHPQS